MEAALKPECVSADEYLESEELAEIKHEYVGGLVYAMAGTSRDHNLIALNIASRLSAHLAGGSCRTYMSNVKVRLRHLENDIFYYPDAMVGCDPRDTASHYVSQPKVIVEVLSKNTERLDRREKFWAYRSAASLEEYLLVAQDKAEVTVHRRLNNWWPEVVIGTANSLELQSLEFSLPLGVIYEGVKT